ncbi:MAG: Crp/Fnr family transcriptional regulator [Pseudomonadota bacterium]
MADHGRRHLAQNDWLSGLPEAARHDLIDAARIRRFAAEERVQGKGQPADGLYGLLEGEVRISATTFAGDEILFTRLVPGQWFGEIAVLDGGVRTHDAHAIVGSTLAVVPSHAILGICERYPAVYRALVALLCEHCRLAFSAIDEFLVYSHEQRLSRRVLQRCPEGVGSRVTISQQEMGALIGVSRQSINKILKAWEARGWIRRVYRGLEVLDAAALRRLS